jgi:hypothetical protein
VHENKNESKNNSKNEGKEEGILGIVVSPAPIHC